VIDVKFIININKAFWWLSRTC